MEKYLDAIVEDKVTGYNGKVTAYAVYSTGYNALLVESIDATGRPVEQWIDERRVEFI